jgi:hypothetical protein
MDTPYGLDTWRRLKDKGGIERDIRSQPKKVFSPDIGVDASFQVLDILEYVPQGDFLRGA